ncbi:hypothetical protein A5647_24265 [Mycobacterium sp. 1100029.7]|nr:hypothetical protein A5647_24265 [Mycobacterium sp. 1100029.7]
MRALTAVLLIACGATAVWVLLRPRDSHNDCVAVEQLGRQWIAMSHSITALQDGAGERDDLMAIADKEASMAQRIRAAAGSVSDPAVKEQLGKWADATALLANSQRDSAHRPSQSTPPHSEDADYYRAAVMTREATAALLQTCPQLPREAPAH